jgi:CheY-like chemotaxis protein
VKFTPAGGSIEIASERRNGSLAISVSDTGPGVSPEMLPRIFERFRQAESAQDRRHSGLGLGLAIVRHVVEMHGGSVRAESAEPGGGARFIVTLPAYPGDRTRRPRREPPRARTDVDAGAQGTGRSRRVEPESFVEAANGIPVPEPDPPSLAGTRVLLVEDEEDTRVVVTRILAWRGAEVSACASAREARALLESQRPNVLVSDIGMPEESGYSLIESVRTAERATGAHVPAIALTAYAHETHRLRALASGYDAHVSKPVDPVELVRAVDLVRGGAASVGR